MNGIQGSRTALFFFSAWVFCIDISSSLQPMEFNHLKEIFQGLIQEYVAYEDAVWLIRIGKGSPLLFSIRMPPPPQSQARQEVRTAKETLKKAKDSLLNEVKGLKQEAEETNLYDPTEKGLKILQEQATPKKYFIMGSDFIQHTHHNGAMTIEPRTPPEGLRVNGTKVLLFFGRPDDSHLEKLHMTELELYENIRKKWGMYFKKLGARDNDIKIYQAASRQTTRCSGK